MVSSYFLKTKADQWCMRNALKDLESQNPELSTRQLLDLLKQNLKDLAKEDSDNSGKAVAASRNLQKWRSIKSDIFKVPEKRTADSDKHYSDKAQEGSSCLPFKRAFSEENSSAEWSWDSSGKSRTKRIMAYLSSTYGETDFGGVDDQDSRVKIIFKM
ncbi:hypothetical protein CLU79DRAFT_777786 [Phycomyces nitens]|nr:hypothetical protein CLU79DRAFT_777786 [Phycomyces nitens]